MHAGLIGGIGPAATDYYYRGLIRIMAARGLPLDLTLAFSLASVVGVVFGVRLSAGLAPVQLRRAFAAFVVLIGLSLLVTNLLPIGE